MAPQDSAIISKKNSNVSNISTSIDLSKTNTRDHSYMKFTEQSERDNANDTQPMTQSVMVSNSKYYSFPYPI
jgi:trehalose/maltose hydrolase-like predicted phosphorylase